MDGIRLRVQVLPRGSSESGTTIEAPLKAFALAPVPKELSIAELGGLIEKKFERLHTNEG